MTLDSREIIYKVLKQYPNIDLRSSKINLGLNSPIYPNDPNIEIVAEYHLYIEHATDRRHERENHPAKSGQKMGTRHRISK